MKHLVLSLFLVTGLYAQEQAVPLIDKHPPINHVFQGRGTNYCATATVLMAAQRITSLNLKDNDRDLIVSIAGLHNTSATTTRGRANQFSLSRCLGFNLLWIRHNATNIKLATPEEFALVKLKEEIIPQLDNGNITFLTVKKRGAHSILLTSFNHENQTFVVYDSVKLKGPDLIQISDIAKCWPVGGSLWGGILTVPPATTPTLIDPPQDFEQNVNLDNLSNITLSTEVKIPSSHQEFSKSKFDAAITDARIACISTNWEPKRKVDEVHGIALWLKVKVAQGDPACLFFSKSDGSKKIVAVTGYRGGYKNFEGEMQITEIGEDGKLVKSWMKSAEVLQKGKSPRDCGGDSFYIIYPKKPIVAVVVSEAKD